MTRVMTSHVSVDSSSCQRRVGARLLLLVLVLVLALALVLVLVLLRGSVACLRRDVIFIVGFREGAEGRGEGRDGC